MVEVNLRYNIVLSEIDVYCKWTNCERAPISSNKQQQNQTKSKKKKTVKSKWLKYRFTSFSSKLRRLNFFFFSHFCVCVCVSLVVCGGTLFWTKSKTANKTVEERRQLKIAVCRLWKTVFRCTWMWNTNQTSADELVCIEFLFSTPHVDFFHFYSASVNGSPVYKMWLFLVSVSMHVCVCFFCLAYGLYFTRFLWVFFGIISSVAIGHETPFAYICTIHFPTSIPKHGQWLTVLLVIYIYFIHTDVIPLKLNT